MKQQQCLKTEAIANAVYDATGVRVKELPIYPYKIVEALEKKE